MTQYLVEEAIYERIEHVERQVRQRTADLTAAEFDGSVPGISPGEKAATEHAAKMARLGVN